MLKGVPGSCRDSRTPYLRPAVASRSSQRERKLSGTPVGGEPVRLYETAAPTSAVALLVVGFNALSVEQQEQAFQEISELRLQRIAGEEGETARFLRSLRRAQDYVGEELSPDKYREAWRGLKAQGEEVAEFNQVRRHFGSWRRAKEALHLSETSTPLKIEARFRARMVGKPGRYRDETLRETLAQCVQALGHIPLVIDYELWRQKETELGKAQGREVFIPSDSPYRRRFGSWENALLHFGYPPEEVKARLEPSREKNLARLAEMAAPKRS
jgi:hypothetical protein